MHSDIHPEICVETLLGEFEEPANGKLIIVNAIESPTILSTLRAEQLLVEC